MSATPPKTRTRARARARPKPRLEVVKARTSRAVKSTSKVVKTRATQTARRTLGIVVQTPRPTRVTQVINKLLLVVLRNPLVDIAATAVLVLVITEKTREGGRSLWLSIGLFCVLAALYVFVASQAMRILQAVTRWIGGPPAYGEIGGLPRNILHAAIRSCQDMRFSFTKDDAALMDQLAKLDESLTKSVLGERFVEQRKADESASPRKLAADWAHIWKTEVLEYRHASAGSATTRDAWTGPSYAMLVVPYEFPRVAGLVLPIFFVSQTVLVGLVYRAVNNIHDLLLVLQVGVAFSFLISIVIFLNVTQGLRELHMMPVDVEQLPEDFKTKVANLAGTRLVPTKVVVGAGYQSALRGYFTRAIALTLSYNLLFQLAILGISLAGLLVVKHGVPGGVLDWYGNFALGLMLIAVGIAVGYLAISFLLEFARGILGAVVGGLVAAVVSPVIFYLSTGHAPKSVVSIAASLGTAAVMALAAAAGARAKSKVSAD